MTQPEEHAEFENYKLWLARIREERGTQGVAEATFRLYTENRRLRAELQQSQRASTKVVVKPASAIERPVSTGRTVQLAQGEQTRAAIYSFLQSYFNEHNQSPSIREIARAVKKSTVVVTRHLNRLEREGIITREPGVERGIRLV